MTLQLTIKEPLKQTAPPTNLVRLHITSMFGDADGYETTHFDYSPEDEEDRELAYQLVHILEEYSKLDWNAQCDFDSDSNWRDLYDNVHDADMPADVCDQLSDLIPYSSFSDSKGHPDRWWITYFDATGIEHNVSVTVDGKPMAGHR